VNATGIDVTQAERSRRFFIRHRETVLDRAKRWRNADPWRKARYARHSAKQTAIKYGLDGGTLTKEDFARLHLLPCVYCGEMPAMGVDHVIPFVAGGPNSLANLAPAHLRCNQSKSARDRDGARSVA
jgi:5-methylcytosine-specific restriction endonuclease McrA